jgi:hypothetical protein
MSAYVAAAVTEFDPAKGGGWPSNPRLVASAGKDHQMRPKALLFDRRYVWMATSPKYGELGGALSRIDPETNEIKVWRNIVPDQTINGLALDLKKRRVYLSSEIHADMQSAPPTQSTAQVVAFDMNALEVVKRKVVREGAPAAGVLCVLNDARVLVHEENRYYAWEVEGDRMEALGTLPGVAEVAKDSRGEIWAAVGGAIGRFTVNGNRIAFERVIEQEAAFLRIEDEVMYYVVGKVIYATAMEELRERGGASQS